MTSHVFPCSGPHKYDQIGDELHGHVVEAVQLESGQVVDVGRTTVVNFGHLFS